MHEKVRMKILMKRHFKNWNRAKLLTANPFASIGKGSITTIQSCGSTPDFLNVKLKVSRLLIIISRQDIICGHGMENVSNHGNGETNGACKEKVMPVQPNSGNRFSKMKLLGSGTFGEVWKGFDGKLKCWVAIKTFQEVSTKNLGISMLVIREISLLKKLNHPNIMRMLDVLIGENFDSKGLAIVMELEEMDLHDYQRKFGKFLSLSKVEFIIRQVLEGCSYLHSNHVMHRDLKPDNILICTATGMTRIADFGYARTFSNINVAAASSSRYSWPIQAPSYKAPEVLLGCDCYTSAVDVWSIGCIFCELLSGGRKLFGAAGIAPGVEPEKRSNRKRGRHEDSVAAMSRPHQVDKLSSGAQIDSISSSCERNGTLASSLTAIFKIFGPLSDNHAPALRQLSLYKKFAAGKSDICIGQEKGVSRVTSDVLYELIEPHMRDVAAMRLLLQLLYIDPVKRVTCSSALRSCFFDSATWSAAQ